MGLERLSHQVWVTLLAGGRPRAPAPPRRSAQPLEGAIHPQVRKLAWETRGQRGPRLPSDAAVRITSASPGEPKRDGGKPSGTASAETPSPESVDTCAEQLSSEVWGCKSDSRGAQLGPRAGDGVGWNPRSPCPHYSAEITVHGQNSSRLEGNPRAIESNTPSKGLQDPGESGGHPDVNGGTQRQWPFWRLSNHKLFSPWRLGDQRRAEGSVIGRCLPAQPPLPTRSIRETCRAIQAKPL